MVLLINKYFHYNKNQVKHTPLEYINKMIIWKLNR